jgi:hypothetical protein
VARDAREPFIDALLAEAESEIRRRRSSDVAIAPA